MPIHARHMPHTCPTSSKRRPPHRCCAQLGPVMAEFSDQTAAFMSLGRALFGDFDMNDVLENSNSYTNLVMYIAYLFTAVFVMLSMFFAILGESQANLREDQREKRKKGKLTEDEYGVFTSAMQMCEKHILFNLPKVGTGFRERAEEKRRQEDLLMPNEGPSAVDRIEARQLQMSDKIQDTYAARQHARVDMPSNAPLAGPALPLALLDQPRPTTGTRVRSFNEVNAQINLVDAKLDAVTQANGLAQQQISQLLELMLAGKSHRRRKRDGAAGLASAEMSPDGRPGVSPIVNGSAPKERPPSLRKSRAHKGSEVVGMSGYRMPSPTVSFNAQLPQRMISPEPDGGIAPAPSLQENMDHFEA